jgi:hypothetical protein
MISIHNNPASNTWKKYCVVLPILIWAVLAGSCSAESTSKDGNTNFTPINDNAVGGNTGSSVTNGNIGSSNPSYGGGGGNIATGTNGAAATNGTELGTDVCAGAHVRASRVTPTVMFVVDQSLTMADPYPGSASKWQATYDALMDPNEGVVARLQSVVRFGITLFFGPIPGVSIAGDIVTTVLCVMDGTCADAAIGDCPSMTVVNPELDNFNKINEAYQPNGPAGTTPTALALERAYALISTDNAVLDQKDKGTPIVILCTDGLPNGCGADFSTPDEEGPIKQVTDAAARGIKTYIVGVAATNDTGDGGVIAGPEAQAYLDRLATFGGTNAPAFSPATKADLIGSLSKIVSGAVGCNVRLNGPKGETGKVAAGHACDGTVYLNSEILECNGPNGWKLFGESEIELQGTACQRFMNDPTSIVNASFPCDVFILQ